MQDVASRMRGRVQLTTDGHRPYLSAVERAWVDIDYATLTKIYGLDPKDERRSSPPICLSCESKVVTASTDAKHTSTSYVERPEPLDADVDAPVYAPDKCVLKRVENHAAAVALYFMYYNVGRVHSTLRVTPAMEAGVSDHIWEVEEIVSLLEN